jgi:hypothetical protein
MLLLYKALSYYCMRPYRPLRSLLYEAPYRPLRSQQVY